MLFAKSNKWTSQRIKKKILKSNFENKKWKEVKVKNLLKKMNYFPETLMFPCKYLLQPDIVDL